MVLADVGTELYEHGQSFLSDLVLPLGTLVARPLADRPRRRVGLAVVVKPLVSPEVVVGVVLSVVEHPVLQEDVRRAP